MNKHSSRSPRGIGLIFTVSDAKTFQSKLPILREMNAEMESRICGYIYVQKYDSPTVKKESKYLNIKF